MRLRLSDFQSLDRIRLWVVVISETPEFLAVYDGSERGAANVTAGDDVTNGDAIALAIVATDATLRARELARRYGFVGVVQPFGDPFSGLYVMDIPARQ